MARTLIRSVFGLVVTLGIASFLVPLPEFPYPPITFQAALSLSAIFTVLYIGGLTFLLSSLPKFKARLKRAYILLSFGFLLLTVAQVLAPIATLLGWWGQAWFDSMHGMVYLFAVLLVYLGFRAFGRLLQIRGLATSFTFAILAFIPIGFLLSFLPNHSSSLSNEAFISLVVSSSGLVWLLMISTWIVWRIKKEASTWYQTSMTWIFWSMVSLTVAMFFFVLRAIVAPDEQYTWGYIQTLMLLPYVVSGYLLFEGARRFYNIGQQGIIELPAAQRFDTSADIIVYAASLASVRNALDITLDRLRNITAATPQAQQPSRQKEFMSIYLAVEAYLVEQDPARKYDRMLLRDFISKRIIAKNTSSTFWPQLLAAGVPKRVR